MATQDDTLSSLKRVQSFDASSLVRREELGAELNFAAAEAPAKRVIDLFLQVSPEHLASLPATSLRVVKDSADAFFNTLEEIQKFKATMDGASGHHSSYLQRVTQAYETTFSQLHPIISYIASR